MRGRLITVSSVVRHITAAAVIAQRQGERPLAAAFSCGLCILLVGGSCCAVGLILLVHFPCFHGQRGKRVNHNLEALRLGPVPGALKGLHGLRVSCSSKQVQFDLV